MASATFPNLAPIGTPPGPPSIPPPAFKVGNTTCDPGFLGINKIGCDLGNFFAPVLNGIVQLGSIGGVIIGYFFGLLTFQIPALQGNPFLQLVNLMIVVPILVVLGLFLFRLVKSIVPTVGGDAD